MAATRKTTKKSRPTRKVPSKTKAAAAGPRQATKKKTTGKTTDAKAAKMPSKKSEKAPNVKKTTKTRSAATTTPSAKAPAKKEAKPVAEKKPRKPVFDAEFLKQVRDSLLDERRSLMAMMQSTQEQLAGRDTGLADLSDIASGGFEDELAIGLMASEAATLEKIDDAIQRIDDGTYGMCLDCEKPIPKKRLEFLPFAQRCMDCEGGRERRARMGAAVD